VVNNLNSLYLGIIIGVIAIGIGVGVFLISQTGQQQIHQTTTTTTSAVQKTTTIQPTTNQQSGIDISGTWEGTFTASKWPGEKKKTGKWK